MIYITGDTHGDVRRLNTDSFPEQKTMTKEDYVIILGDFGMIWNWEGESSEEKYWLNWLDTKPFTTLFIDGNHENFDRLYEFPIEEWHGGKVQKIRPSIIHLMRGQIYNIEELRIFTFGGASSHDIQDGVLEPDDPRIKIWYKDYTKMYRVNKRSWWEQELPNKREMAEGLTNLENADWNLDFILTHCAPASTTTVLSDGTYKQDVLTGYLEEIKNKASYKIWFFGHHHTNKSINSNEMCLFEQIIRIH